MRVAARALPQPQPQPQLKRKPESELVWAGYNLTELIAYQTDSPSTAQTRLTVLPSLANIGLNVSIHIQPCPDDVPTDALTVALGGALAVARPHAIKNAHVSRPLAITPSLSPALNIAAPLTRRARRQLRRRPRPHPVTLAQPPPRRQQKRQSSTRLPRTQLQSHSKVVVEKLTKNVTAGHLHEIFGAYGAISDLDMPMNRQFATNRGTAYILFAAPAGAESAIAHMHEAQLDGAQINVSIVLPRRRFSRSPPARRPPPNRFGEPHRYGRDAPGARGGRGGGGGGGGGGGHVQACAEGEELQSEEQEQKLDQSEQKLEQESAAEEAG
ncbi:hypothetical protein MBLNU459_g1157t1 [Dothideomycetes sp. NU459]